MKKSYNKGVYITFIIMLMILFIPKDIKAEVKAEGSEDKTAKNKACEGALYKYNNGKKYFFTVSEEKEKYIITLDAKDGKWDVRYYYGDEDDFDYSEVITATPNGTFEYVGGSSYSFDVLRKKKKQQSLVVIAELKGNSDNRGLNKNGNELKAKYGKNNSKTTTCKSGSVKVNENSKFKITGTGAVMTKTIKAKTTKEEGNDLNSEEDTKAECDLMKKAFYRSNSTDAYIDSAYIDAYNEQMRQSFPYCYGTTYSSSFKISAKTVRKVRKSSLKAYKEYIKYLKSVEKNKEYEKAEEEINNTSLSYKNKTNTSIGTLSCDKKQSNENTERFYHRETVLDNNACNVTCQEQLEVTYDPPQATKAGLCIQYKVTVKSKVTCKTELKSGNINWPSTPSFCSYSPICEGNEAETQAGPNEEFDSCISSCDGGAYSQSCINTCYNKVYGTKKKENKTSIVKNTSSSKSMSINNTNSTNILQLANSKKDPYYYENEDCDTNDEILSNIGVCSKVFYKLKQKYPLGYYESLNDKDRPWANAMWVPCYDGVGKDSEKCKFTNDDDEENSDSFNYTIDRTTDSQNGSLHTPNESVIEAIKRSSPYYFRNLETATKTIKSFYGYDNGVNGYGTPRKYNIDKDGIKRQMTSTYKCGENCAYRSDDGDATLTNCKNTDEAVRDYYEKAFEAIKNELKGCSSSVECKEDTSTFDISVDNSDKNNTTTNWKATNETSKDEHTCKNPQGVNSTYDVNMFIPLTAGLSIAGTDFATDANDLCKYDGINGRCYAKDNPSYWQHYKTTITFPGTWINLKTAARKYTDSGIDTNTYYENKNKYCVGFDVGEVNPTWWNWKVNGTCDTSSGKDGSDISVENDKNIKAKINDFGKFNWNVDVNCFYGVSNTIGVIPESESADKNCPPPPPGGETCEDENSTEICNIGFRSITEQNLFPDKEGTGSRESGFNWKSKAKDNTISEAVNNLTGYGIDPGEYAKEIESQAASNPDIGFSGTADYYIHLTKDNIKQLRAYAKKNGYTLYEGQSKNPVNGVEGLYYYKSNLLNNKTYIDSFSRNVNLGINNN